MGDAFCVVIAGGRSLATAKGFSKTFVPDAGASHAQNLGVDFRATQQPFRARPVRDGVVGLAER